MNSYQSIPQVQPVQPTEQRVELYKDGFWIKSAAKRFRKDAQHLAKTGWRVQSQSAERVGWHRRGITVVYVR